jgi:hypothetical protein
MTLKNHPALCIYKQCSLNLPLPFTTTTIASITGNVTFA